MKRILITIAVVFGVAWPASAQLTPAPFVLQQYFDNNGDPLSAGGMCVFRAGTSTLASSYTTSGGSTANANPLLFNSAGRPSSNGFFLVPGQSYKLVLVDFTGIAVPACSPINGVTIWTQDNIEATPGSSAAVDIPDATAGESLAAGDAVFLSNGAGSLNAGQWYRMDADLTYRSTSATMVGVVPNAINSGATGAVRIYGAVTVTGPLSPGAPYYAGATPGALVILPPPNAIRIGTAQSATDFVVGYTVAPVSPRGPPCGRLTPTTGVPYATADVTAVTTVYYSPAGNCNSIFLYDGTAWNEYAFAELSIAVPATTNTGYDVYAFDNAGVVGLELTAWSSLTARATATVLTNGVWVKTGVPTRRYLGSFRTTGVSGQTESSFAKRYIWNQDNRMRLLCRVAPTADSWTYTMDIYQQWNADAANQCDFFIGQIGPAIHTELQGFASNAGAISVSVSMGVNGITASTVAVWRWETTKAGVATSVRAALDYYPAIGQNYVTALERSAASGTTTWLGDNGGSTQAQSAIWGWTEG